MPHLQLKRDIQRKTGTCANQKIREVLHTSDYTPKNSPPHKWNGKVKPIRLVQEKNITYPTINLYNYMTMIVIVLVINNT